MSKKNKEIVIEKIYCILFLAWYCEGTAAFEVNNLTNGRLPYNIFALCCLVWATRGIHFRHHTTANTLLKTIFPGKFRKLGNAAYTAIVMKRNPCKNILEINIIRN